MQSSSSYLEVILEATRVAFPLEDVAGVIRAIAVHATPGAGGCLLGAADLAGELVPVYDLRRLLGLRRRPLRASDRFVLTRAPSRCALVVDAVSGLATPGPTELGAEFSLQASGLRGVVRSGDGVLLVQDLRRLLAFERAIPIKADA